MAIALYAIGGRARDAASLRHAAARDSASKFLENIPAACLKANLSQWPALRKNRRLAGVDASWIKFETPKCYEPFAARMFKIKWMPRWLGRRFLDWFGYLGEYIPWNGDPRLQNHIPLLLPLRKSWKNAEILLEGQEFGEINCPGCAKMGFDQQWAHLAFLTHALECGTAMHAERTLRILQVASVYALFCSATAWIVVSVIAID